MRTILSGITKIGRTWFHNRLPNWRPPLDPEVSRRNAETVAMICLAGDVAQRLYNPRSSRRWHFRRDHDRAREAIRSHIAFSTRSTEAYLDYLKVRVEEMLGHNWNLLAALAQELLRQRTLDGEAIEKFIREYNAAQGAAEQSQDLLGESEL
jgi:hypothetical protein